MNTDVFGIKKKHTPNSERKAGARNFHLRAERKRRQSEAAKRNLNWVKLSPNQQLKSLDDREMVATKQRRKILERIAEKADAKPSRLPNNGPGPDL